MPREEFGSERRRQQEALQLVAQYEEMQRNDTTTFFDLDVLEHIIEYYEDHFEFDKALEVIDLAAEQHPFSATVLIKKAQLLIDRKDYETALLLLDKAQLFAPNEIEIILLQAEVYTHLNSYDDAIALLNTALAQHADTDNKVDLLLTIADIYEISGKEKRAYSYYKKVLKLKPNNEQALSNIDYLVENCGLFEDSISLHKHIIDQDPYCFLAWYNLGNAYFGLQQYAKAIDAYEFVTAINEKYDLAYRNIGEAYFNLNDFERSRHYYIEALVYAAEPDDEIHYNIALSHFKLNQYTRALAELKHALEINPENAEAWFLRGNCWANLQYKETAFDCYNRALSIDPDKHEYLTHIASLHAQEGNFDTAITFYQFALEKAPDQWQYWANLSFVYAQIEQFDEAEALNNAAINKFGENAQTLIISSVCHWHKGQRYDAMAALIRATQQNKDAYLNAIALLPTIGHNKELQLMMQALGVQIA